jgi:RNA-binding protein Musashi
VIDEEFKDYFEQFGTVLDATLMMDKETGRPRGFGFVTFDDDSAVENCMAHGPLAIKGKMVRPNIPTYRARLTFRLR